VDAMPGIPPSAQVFVSSATNKCWLSDVRFDHPAGTRRPSVTDEFEAMPCTHVAHPRPDLIQMAADPLETYVIKVQQATPVVPRPNLGEW
jgi:hypothetical protein